MSPNAAPNPTQAGTSVDCPRTPKLSCSGGARGGTPHTRCATMPAMRHGKSTGYSMRPR